MQKTSQNIIAVIYDFDGTLSPNNMQEDTLFRAYGVDQNEFWKKADELVQKSGYEPTLAYLKLLLYDETFQNHPLRREDLASLANQIKYYPGVDSYFEEIQKFLSGLSEVREWKITMEHYIVSSGMKEILEGAKIVKYFKKVYACEYEYQNGVAVFPKLVINDTNKTQFLFRINKGKLNLGEDINGHMPEEERRIPFRNMIYIGDSHTDVPSMTVMQRFGGHAIAVFDPAKGRPEKALKMVEEGRAGHFTPADFRKGSLLVKIIQRTLKKIVSTIAYHSSAQMSFDWMKKHKKRDL
ncbi:MAG: haloacid dehalogenase-like hydrolase [Chlamydiae bacterium]|nr:haloacid dehalogenase-like hydrolase [Chlamydiota bacterium]